TQHSRQAEQRLREVGLDFVEHGFAQPRWNVRGHNLGDAANAVLIFADGVDRRDHPLGGGVIGTTHVVRFAVRQGFDFVECDGCGVGYAGDYVAHLLHAGDDIAVEGLADQFLRDRAGGDAGGRFAGAAATASAIIAETVLRVESVVGVAGAIEILNVGV